MLAYMIPTASGDKNPCANAKAATATSNPNSSNFKGSLDKKEENTVTCILPTRISSQAHEQHRKISPYDTTSLRQARTLANPGSSEFRLLEKRKSHESGGRRSNKTMKRQEAKP
ncbi:unnamed protein product [Sphagnum tenellum]